MKALLPLAAIFLAAGCTQLQQAVQPEAPKAAAPQITEDSLRTRAKEQLALGQRQYEAGEYEPAARSLSAALDHGLLTKPDQARARKLLAFIHCVAGREVLCRDEFRKAFEIFPDFSLTPAEDGHPIWGPVYRDVRTKLITEREAAQQRTRTFIPLSGAEKMLADGLVKYDAGDYDGARALLEDAFKAGLSEKRDQTRALKHVAFSLCLQNRWRDCRAAFARIFEVDPEFDLTPAEAGHPSWTRTFAGVKRAQQAKLAREKSKPSPPAAAVPKKN
jgi:tetratricopeptide (TPR) repeat protein